MYYTCHYQVYLNQNLRVKIICLLINRATDKSISREWDERANGVERAIVTTTRSYLATYISYTFEYLLYISTYKTQDQGILRRFRILGVEFHASKRVRTGLRIRSRITAISQAFHLHYV